MKCESGFEIDSGPCKVCGASVEGPCLFAVTRHILAAERRGEERMREAAATAAVQYAQEFDIEMPTSLRMLEDKYHARAGRMIAKIIRALPLS